MINELPLRIVVFERNFGHRRRQMIVRDAGEILGVNADATQAAFQEAAATGSEPDFWLSDVLRWAIGHSGLLAPVTGMPVGPDGPDLATELETARTIIDRPWDPAESEEIERARSVLDILEWLTGVSDLPPTFRIDTQPGDLMRGRGPVVRESGDIEYVIALATLFADHRIDLFGRGRSPGWHAGVAAALNWILGTRLGPPVSQSDRHERAHGLPSGEEIVRECQTAWNMESRPHHGDLPSGYAGGVVAALTWVTGKTTEWPEGPPVPGALHSKSAEIPAGICRRPCDSRCGE